MWALFLWLITAVHASGKPCCKAAGACTSHLHGLFGDCIRQKKNRGKKKPNQQMKTKVYVYFPWSRVSGVQNTLCVSVESAGTHEFLITGINVITRLMCLVPPKTAPLSPGPLPDCSKTNLF